MNVEKTLETGVVAPRDFKLASLASTLTSQLNLIPDHNDLEASKSDLLILIIEADRGLSQDEISRFNQLRESQIPSIILVTSLIGNEASANNQDRWDFDDVMMLINRTLEKTIAPYLVLHDDTGLPIGLYDLLDHSVIDYSNSKPEREEPEAELKELVKDFQEEIEEENFVPSDFTSGLRVVAIPYIPERRIGIAEVEHFLTMLRQAQL